MNKQDLSKHFDKIAGQKKSLNRGDFHDILAQLEKHGLKRMSDTPFANQLFDALDTNKDSTVDKDEFFKGVNTLVHGTVKEKASRMFSQSITMDY